MTEYNITCDKHIIVTLERDIELEVKDYPCERMTDNDGIETLEYDEPDLPDEEWERLYKRQRYTFPEMLKELISLAKEKMESVGKHNSEYERMLQIIEDAEKWTITETIIEDL